jgi:putative thioredoxin
MSAHVVEIDESNFEREVIEASRETPVLVDFWAPWCAPCRALTPLLEKLAAEFAGKFILAKVNADDHQTLALQFAVRGIPSVKVVLDGAVVDEFTGALPEPAVREFLQRWLPSPGEELRREAMRLHADGDSTRALELLEQARALEPDNDWVTLDRAEVLLAVDRLDEAQVLLDALPFRIREEERAIQLDARLGFARHAAAAGDTAELQARIAVNGDDLEARLALADAWVAQRNYEPALEQLLEVVRRDRDFRDDAGRKEMLSVFTLLGDGGDLVRRYRRLLAEALS